MSTVLTHPEITPRRLDRLAGLRGFELRNPCARLRGDVDDISAPARGRHGSARQVAQKDLALIGVEICDHSQKETLSGSADDRCVWLHVFSEIVICGPHLMPKA
jgi:hypothetical protein